MCDFILATRMLKWRIFPSFKSKSTSVHTNRHGERNHGKGDHGEYESCQWGSLRRKMVVEERAGEAQGQYRDRGANKASSWGRLSPHPLLLLRLFSPLSQNDPLEVKVSLSWYPVSTTSMAPVCSHLQPAWSGLDFRVLSEVSPTCVCSLFSSPKGPPRYTHTLASSPLELQNFRPTHPEIYCILSDFS